MQLTVNPNAREILPFARLVASIARCDVLCCLLHDTIDATVIDAAPTLRMISDGAINPTNVDVAHARKRGIVVATIPNVVAEATAELQWALLLAIARRIPEADRELRRGLFPGAQSVYLMGAAVGGKVLGSIGFGAVGLESAKRARGFGMQILYTKRERLGREQESEAGIEFRSLDDLLRESDFVVLNAAYTAENHHLIGARELGLMKPTAYFINTSRGPLVDEAALAGALRRQAIAGAALDVYEHEPRVHVDLIELDNVVLTPHLGSGTLETRVRIADCIVDNVLAFLREAG
ncbi:MAG: D-glycerate dehydrogenase [Candidatus Eremiobacteraeota bacterium]|nr:D-glycerate dehydrogenase [Candidatus Eremiobacteraeota bacterium]